jgi:hypothetical protein
MPIDCHVDAGRRRVIWTGSGRATGEELFEADRILRAHPEARPDFDHLQDYLAVTEVAVSAQDLRKLATRPPFFGPTSKRAVVGRGPLMFGNTRMFELQRGSVAGEFRFFEKREDAERWLAGDDSSGPAPADIA